MLQSLKTQWKRGADTLSRRELFRRSALLTLPALFQPYRTFVVLSCFRAFVAMPGL
jgi:hypothetical protein